MATRDQWRPSAARHVLRQRADLLARIRTFFASRGVLEVDTPALGASGATDPALSNLSVSTSRGTRYLQTSPEFAMKRLLAAGSGDIYQLGHVFRREIPGPLHLEEFTMLEWYRLGFDHHQLMDEVAALLVAVGFERAIERLTYRDVCQRQTGLDPHRAATDELAAFARSRGATFNAEDYANRRLLLDYVLGCAMLAQEAGPGALFIYDFPVEQAAYARIREGEPRLAERFELIVDGIELANGYHEVTDPHVQRTRHEHENQRRETNGLETIPLDAALLAALDAGLPACAGVALGIDRLLMILAGCDDISAVVAFSDG